MDFIPKALQDYAQNNSDKEPEILQELNRETYVKMLFPRMLSGHHQGRFLSMISKLVKPKRALEIGTFTGYAAICLAEGLADGGSLITMDKNEELKDLAQSYFKKAGLKDQIDLMIGNAMELVPKLEGPFDLVFIDADKQNYLNYYEMILPKVSIGGIILADNVLWSGHVLDEDVNDKETKGIRSFNKFVTEDERVEKVMVTLRDGITMIRKK